MTDAMDDEQVDKVVADYLKVKGYELRPTGDEARRSMVAAAGADQPINPITAYLRAENSDPTKYKEAYRRLRNWVYGSLDLYKPELLRVLYPVFVHSYMNLVAKGQAQEARSFFQSFRDDHEPEHLRDLQILEGVISPHHLQENEMASTLRENKVNIKMCQYSFELLLQHLDNTNSMVMLGLINAHLSITVQPGQPSGDDEEEAALPAKIQAAADATSQTEIRWGILEDSVEDKYEKELAAEAEKAAELEKEAEAEELKKRSEGKPGPPKKLKNYKAGKGLKPEPIVRPRIKPELTMPILTDSFELSVLEDIRNRVKLSSSNLPSVSFYTLVNTQNSLNCASISPDGAFMVGGFSDSSLKLWDMVKMGRPSAYSESKASSYIRLVGHSGPVYGVDFSPEGDFLLSSSGDSTIRLWSVESTLNNQNLVCYKGHNYPVWDVQYSPMGHYFASASYDRTARVWSMDRTQPLRIMAGHLSDVDCVQWHVNCNYIATGSSDKTVRLWDVQSGECVRVFTGHKSRVLSLAMSPDGRYMASGDEDGAIMMWDLPSGRCVTPLIGHSGCIWSLAFSGEGSILASGSEDNTLRLWDVTGSKPAIEKLPGARKPRHIKTFPTKSTPVYTLRFSRRNLLFAAGAFQGN